MMKLCRFQWNDPHPRVGLWATDGTIMDLGAAGVQSMESLLESDDLLDRLSDLSRRNLPCRPPPEVRLLATVERQEVWGAGVTYLRSKDERMKESQFSATSYYRVYDAERPELFFKAMPEKVSGPGDPVGIRRDARWNVPEPELALVINSRGTMVGYTLGNDMSSRDLEGENLLYLPQAKIYNHSCALGPTVVVGVEESEVRGWPIRLEIRRHGHQVFQGETSLSLIKRSFAELVHFLYRCQTFPHGAVLLTGTGVVPPEDFTLQPEDQVLIAVPDMGTLENRVIEV